MTAIIQGALNILINALKAQMNTKQTEKPLPPDAVTKGQSDFLTLRDLLNQLYPGK